MKARLFIRYLNEAPYQEAGYYICSHGTVEGQSEPCLNVLDGSFTTEREAVEYLNNNRMALVAVHVEMEACMPSLYELNKQLVRPDYKLC